MPEAPVDINDVMRDVSAEVSANLPGMEEAESPDAESTAEPTGEEQAQEAEDARAEDQDAVDSEGETSNEGEEQDEEAEDQASPYVDVPTIEDDLATQFSVLDSEGEIEIPAIKVRYRAGGKDREDRLDQVVKMAQLGVYNHEKQQRYEQLEEQLPAYKKQAEDALSVLQTREKQIERLLQDEQYLAAVRQRYEQANSPEQVAQRAQTELERERARFQMERVREKGTQFFTSEVKPALETINNALPSVTVDELSERMAKGLRMHTRTGPDGQPYIPPESYDEVRSYILEDLSYWAQVQHQKRNNSSPQSKGQEDAQRKLEQARVQAQKAKRAVGKKTRPVGKPTPERGRKKAREIKNVDDATSAALEEVLSAMNL